MGFERRFQVWRWLVHLNVGDVVPGCYDCPMHRRFVRVTHLHRRILASILRQKLPPHISVRRVLGVLQINIQENFASFLRWLINRNIQLLRWEKGILVELAGRLVHSEPFSLNQFVSLFGIVGHLMQPDVVTCCRLWVLFACRWLSRHRTLLLIEKMRRWLFQLQVESMLPQVLTVVGTDAAPFARTGICGHVLIPILVPEEGTPLGFVLFASRIFISDNLLLDIRWLILLKISLEELDPLLHQTQTLIEVILLPARVRRLILTLSEWVEVVWWFFVCIFGLNHSRFAVSREGRRVF